MTEKQKAVSDDYRYTTDIAGRLRRKANAYTPNLTATDPDLIIEEQDIQEEQALENDDRAIEALKSSLSKAGKAAKALGKGFGALLTTNVTRGGNLIGQAGAGLVSKFRETPNYDFIDWTKDAYISFMNKRDDINIMANRGYLRKDILPVIRDIDFQHNFLDKQIQYNQLQSEYERTKNPELHDQALSLLADLTYEQGTYDAIMQKYGNAPVSDPMARMAELRTIKEQWIKDANAVYDDIEELEKDLEDRNNWHKVSDYYQKKEEQPFQFTSLDSWLFKTPGLAGSSAATAESYLLSYGGAVAAQYGKTQALRAASWMGGPETRLLGEAAANIMALGGGMIVLGSNLYARENESQAEVFGAYKDRIKSALGDNLPAVIAEGKKYLQDNGQLGNLTDEQILDRMLTDQIPSSDPRFNKLKVDGENGLTDVYNANMALSASDLVEQAVTLSPVGALFKNATSSVRKPLSDATRKIVDKTLGRYIEYGIAKVPSMLKSNTVKTVGRTLAKAGFVAASEGMEEGIQDVLSRNYQKGKYDRDTDLPEAAGWVKGAWDDLGAASRVARTITGIAPDPELASDPEFWENVKGGAALGLLMHAGGRALSARSSYKDYRASKQVQEIVTQRIAGLDALNKSMYYADPSIRNNIGRIVTRLEDMKSNLPEGVTEKDIDDEISRAKRISSLAIDRTSKDIAKRIGISTESDAYKKFIALRYNALEKRKQAIKEVDDLNERATVLFSDANESLRDDLTIFETEMQPVAKQIAQAKIYRDAAKEIAEEWRNNGNNQQKGFVSRLEERAKELDKQVKDLISNVYQRTETYTEEIQVGEDESAVEEISRERIVPLTQGEIETLEIGFALPTAGQEASLLAREQLIANLLLEDDTNRYLALNGKKLVNGELQDASPEEISSIINKFDETIQQNRDQMATDIQEANAEKEATVPNANGEVVTIANTESTKPDESFEALPSDETPAAVTPQPTETIEPQQPKTKGTEEVVVTVPVTDEEYQDDIDWGNIDYEQLLQPVSTPTVAPTTNVTKSPSPDATPNVGTSTQVEPNIVVPVTPTFDPAKLGKPTAANPEETGEVTPETPTKEEIAEKVEELVEEIPETVHKDTQAQENTQEKLKKDEQSYEDSIDWGGIDYEQLGSSQQLPQTTTSVEQSIPEAPQPELPKREQLAAISDDDINTASILAGNDNLTSEQRSALAAQGILADMIANVNPSSDRRADIVSRTLYYSTTGPKPYDLKDGLKYKTGKELGEFLANPKAIEESTLEFKVVPFGKNYNPADPKTYDDAGIYLTITHPSGHYAAALKTTQGARYLYEKLNTAKTGRNILSMQQEVAISRLADFRKAIIEASINLKPNQMLVPTEVNRTNGVFASTGEQRSVSKIPAFNIPSNPLHISPETVKIGIGKGVRGKFAITDQKGNILPGLGGSGQVFIYPSLNNTPSGKYLTNVQVNATRFKSSPEIIDLVYDLLVNYRASEVNYVKDGLELPLTAKELLSFIINWGKRTLVAPQDAGRLSWLLPKQLNISINEGIPTLQVGRNIYNLSAITPEDTKNIKAQIANTFHWNINKETIFRTLPEVFPKVKNWFQNNNAEELRIADGIYFTRAQFEEARPVTMLSWLISTGKLTSDATDNIFKDPFLYAEDFKVVERTNAPEIPATPEPAPINTEDLLSKLGKPTAANPEQGETTTVKDNAADLILGDFFGGAPRVIESTPTSELTEEELTDVMNMLGLSLDTELQIVDNAIALGKSGKQAMGLMREDAIILWNGAESGTAYHEAYHRVSLLLLPERKRKLIYSQYRKRNNAQDLTDNQVEELLAEGFRDYMAFSTPNDYQTIKWYNKLWNAIRRWFRLTDVDIDNIYNKISNGDYAKVKVNEQSLKQFKERYNYGAPFIIEDANGNTHNMKNITVNSYYNIANALKSISLSLHGIDILDDPQNIDLIKVREVFNPENNRKAGLTPEQIAVRDEIYDKFNEVFALEVKRQLSSLGLRAIEQYSDETVIEEDTGNPTANSLQEHILSSIEISRKANAQGAVKLFMATIPMTSFENGQLTVVRDASTGLPILNDFDKTWAATLNYFYDLSTFEGIVNRAAEYGKTNPFYEALHRRLINLKDENLKTMIVNTIDSAKHEMIQVNYARKRQQDGTIRTTFEVRDANLQRATRRYTLEWNSNFLANSDIFTTADNGNITINPTLLNTTIASYNKLVDLLNQYTYNPERYTQLADSDNIDKMKGALISMLNTLSIEVDKATLNDLLRDRYSNPSSLEAFINYVANTSPGSLYQFINNAIKQVADLSQGGKLVSIVTGKEKKLDKVFYGEPAIQELAEFYAKNNPRPEELMVLGANGNMLYPISLPNYLSDTVKWLNNDPETLTNMCNVLYNTGNNGNGSIVLNHLRNGNSIALKTFVNFQEEGTADQGRDYMDISPVEDYMAKMTLAKNDYIVLPTMGDKGMYNAIAGVPLFHERLSFLVNANGNTSTLKFGDNTLDQFINYFEAELDTIEYNYSQEGNLTDEQKIKNYHTKDRLGYRFRYFDGFFTDDVTFNNYNKSLQEADKAGLGPRIIAEIRDFWNNVTLEDGTKRARTLEEKRRLINRNLAELFEDELHTAKELGLVDFQYFPDGRIMKSTIKNLLLDAGSIGSKYETYLMSPVPGISNNATAFAILDELADYFVNSLVSINEFEKLFSKDPAYYKSNDDKIKRVSAVLSTGTKLRLDWPVGHRLNGRTTFRVGEVKDIEVSSRQASYITQMAEKAYFRDILKQMRGLTEAQADAIVKDWENTPRSLVAKNKFRAQYRDVFKAVKDKVSAEFYGYGNDSINIDDASVFISPRMYQDLMEMLGMFNGKVKEAYDLLNDPNADFEAEPERYLDALKTSMGPLKMMYFGDHFDPELKLDVPVFDKMALFPLHKAITAGDARALLNRMEDPSDPIDMVAFESAVKVGNKPALSFYKGKRMEDINVDGLGKWKIYTQNFKYLRRQLVTDPHHQSRTLFATQVAKAALGNLTMDRIYGENKGQAVTGKQIMQDIMGSINALSNKGVSRFLEDIGATINGDIVEFDIPKLYNFLRKDAEASDMGINVLDGLKIIDGKASMPLSALSESKWMETRLLSSLAKETVDIKMPGGAFIQMSSFSHNSIAIASDKNSRRQLQYINPDGSMDAVISINLFSHMIPGYEDMTFQQAKKWLIDHNVIGKSSQAAALGYRIPTQGQASIAALKIVDVLPALINDTIILPDEFTKLTGSDFDIDKLYIASYNYDRKGKRIEFIPSREDIRTRTEQRLRDAGITDEETIAKEVYKAADETKSIYELNSREACENLMLERYLMVMSDDKTINSAKVPLDTATDYLKGKILKKDIDQNKPLPKPFTSLKYLTPSYQLSKKAEYASAKKNLGIFALAGSHHVLTQLGQVSFKPSKTLIKFNMLSLNKQIGEDNIRILDWLSAMINAHVDVAKDPYINRLNVVNYTCNMVNLLLRTGKGEATFYFMPQPILKEIATAVDKVSGRYGVDNTVSAAQLTKRAKDEVLQRYIDAAEGLARGNARYRGKLEKVLKRTKSGYPNLESLNKNVFNIKWLLDQMHATTRDFDWYYNQILIAKTFEELEPYAQSLASLVKYSQIDTKKFGNNFNMQRQFMYGLRNLLLSAPFEGVQRMFETTFLDTKVQNSMLLGQNILDGMLLRTNKSFTSAVDEMLLLTSGLDSADDIYLNNVTNALEASVKTEFFDNYAQQNHINVKELFYGPNTVAKRLRRLKEQINAGVYPDLAGQGTTSSNDLINYLVPKERSVYDSYDAPDFITTPALRGDDANLKNKLIRYYEELLNYPNENIQKLFEDIAIYAFYTSGDNSGINTIFDIVPNSYRKRIGYADFIAGKEQNLSPIEFDLEKVFRNNWYNDKIVPPVKTSYWVTDRDTGTDRLQQMVGYWTDKDDSVLSRYSITIDGETYDYPLVFKNEIARSIGENVDGVKVFPAYVKAKLGYSNNPAATIMYKYIGNHKNKPIYVLINKLGLKHSGNSLYEYGKDTSDMPFNNVVGPTVNERTFYNYFKNRFPGDPMHDVFENFTPIDKITPIDQAMTISYDRAMGRGIETASDVPVVLNISQESETSSINIYASTNENAEQSNPFEGMRQVRILVPDTNISIPRALDIINKLKAEEAKGGKKDDDIGFYYNISKWIDEWNETEAVASLFDDQQFAKDVDDLIDSYIIRNPDMYGTDFSELSKNIKLSEILTNIVRDSGAFVKEDPNQLNLFDDTNFSDQAMKHCKE